MVSGDVAWMPKASPFMDYTQFSYHLSRHFTVNSHIPENVYFLWKTLVFCRKFLVYFFVFSCTRHKISALGNIFHLCFFRGNGMM